MTFKVDPVIMSVSKQSLRQLDRWHKIEDNGSGITYYWQTYSINNNSPSGAVLPVNHHHHYHHHHHNSKAANNNNGGVVKTKTLSKHVIKPHSSSSPIWTAASTSNHTKPPTVVVKKPRARRFINNLLCCFGRKPPEFPLPPLQSDLSPGHYSPKPSEKLLLPPVRACDINKKCLIIDLDETLVHSSFKPVKNPDFIIPVEIDGIIHQVYVLKRPHVDEFLQRIGDLFECILFTASLAKYADPVGDLLDRWGIFRARLFREACVFHKGNYVKDLNRLGRDLKRVIIIDNSPASFAFHPDNAIPVQSWFDDMNDTELLDLIPFLERLSKVDNVYTLLRNSNLPSTLPNTALISNGNSSIVVVGSGSPISNVVPQSETMADVVHMTERNSLR